MPFLREMILNIPVADLALASILVGISVVLMMIYNLNIVTESLLSLGRLFFQLMIIGGVLLFFFKVNDVTVNVILCLFMVLVASVTSASRTPQPGSFGASLIGNSAAAVLTLLPMTLLGVVKVEASFFLPIAAMVIRNTLDRTSLALERLHSEFDQKRGLIEQYLSLGLDPATATRDPVRDSIEASMIPTLNKLKVVGLVGLPGLMTGMIIGAEPGELSETIAYAVSLQTIVYFMIFSGSILSSILVCKVMQNAYFNEREQLTITDD